MHLTSFETFFDLHLSSFGQRLDKLNQQNVESLNLSLYEYKYGSKSQRSPQKYSGILIYFQSVGVLRYIQSINLTFASQRESIPTM